MQHSANSQQAFVIRKGKNGAQFFMDNLEKETWFHCLQQNKRIHIKGAEKLADILKKSVCQVIAINTSIISCLSLLVERQKLFESC